MIQLKDITENIQQKFVSSPNTLSIIAFISGILSIIPIIGILFGPIAIIMGAISLRRELNNQNSVLIKLDITSIVLGSISVLFYIYLLVRFYIK